MLERDLLPGAAVIDKVTRTVYGGRPGDKAIIEGGMVSIAGMSLPLDGTVVIPGNFDPDGPRTVLLRDPAPQPASKNNLVVKTVRLVGARVGRTILNRLGE